MAVGLSIIFLDIGSKLSFQMCEQFNDRLRQVRLILLTFQNLTGHMIDRIF